MNQPPPHVTAAVDQVAAALRELVADARAHAKEGCTVDGVPCPGSAVFLALEAMPCLRVQALLFFAVAELARLGYGEDR